VVSGRVGLFVNLLLAPAAMVGHASAESPNLHRFLKAISHERLHQEPLPIPPCSVAVNFLRAPRRDAAADDAMSSTRVEERARA
jgi:hypothetical protein